MCVADWGLERFVLDHMELKSRSQATEFQLRNVKRWLQDANDPISEEEVAFLHEEDDLIPVVHTPKTVIQRFIDAYNPLGLGFIGDTKV